MGLLGRRVLPFMSRFGASGALGALALALQLAAGCYSPELEDCAVACSAASDCGPGQSCRPDGWCAGPDHATGCGKPGGPGPGGPGGDDDEDDDGESLQMVIEGQGQIEVESSSVSLKETCTSNSSGGTTCNYVMPSGTWVSLRQKEQGGWRFEGWQWPGCGLGKPKTCLVLSGPGTSTVVAKFLSPM